MEKSYYYQLLADHIKKVKTFDLDNDTGGYPTIHWIITNSLLESLVQDGIMTEYEKDDNQKNWVGLTKRNLFTAIESIEDSGVSVYRIIRPGTKKITAVTTDPDYRNAKTYDYRRSVKNAHAKVVSFGRQLVRKHPEHIPELMPSVKRLGGQMAKQLEQPIE